MVQAYGVTAWEEYICFFRFVKVLILLCAGSLPAGSPRSPSASGSLSRNASGELSRRSSGSSTSAGEEPLTWQSMAARWQRWVAVRDAPCPGHPWRYRPSMLQYHYTGDRACILSAKRRSQQGR